MAHPFPHSMTLLRALAEDPPPLVPETAVASVRAAYDQFLRIPPTSANEIEGAIIAYGRIFWPYRKAFETLIREELGPPKLPSGRSGGLAATCRTLIAERGRAECAVRAAVARDPAEPGRRASLHYGAEYQRLVREFQALQHEIEQHIFALRRLAERAADHPEVSSEIMETVRTFERGLAHLAREPNPKEVCAAIETYRERHAEARARQAREMSPRIFR